MRVLVTRPAEQARELVDLLAARGLAGVSVPSVVIRHEPAGSPLDAALDGLTGAAWLVITSANGALALASRLRAMRRGMPSGTRLAAVGPATAAVLHDAGFTVHHVPDEYLTVAIADGLGELHGRRVVLARADAATPQVHFEMPSGAVRFVTRPSASRSNCVSWPLASRTAVVSPSAFRVHAQAPRSASSADVLKPRGS